MSKKKLKVGVLLGGKSAEHEVSLISAKNVINGLDKKKYEVIPIGIDKSGKWFFSNSQEFLQNPEDPKKISLVNIKNKNTKPSSKNNRRSKNEEISVFKESEISNREEQKLDVVFPVLHGPYGEDGSIQGFLKLAGVPFIGAGVLGSALGMDKEIFKKVLRDSGIPVCNFLSYRKGEKIDAKFIIKKLGLPLFVKPVNMGSSVGISKINSEKELKKGINEAFKYDLKIIIESEVRGREIECAVLGNENPRASLPGEVLPTKDFYSYDAKYIDDSALLFAPANLPKKTIKKVQELAIRVFKITNCEGMGRVDMFLKENGELIVNEINTIPGFTAISMYPKLWGVSGLPLPKLLDELISLAIERHNKEKKLKITV